MSINIIERFGEPSKMDSAPYGYVCKVTKKSSTDLYVQLSHNEESPNWNYLGNFDSDDIENKIQIELNALFSPNATSK